MLTQGIVSRIIYKEIVHLLSAISVIARRTYRKYRNHIWSVIKTYLLFKVVRNFVRKVSLIFYVMTYKLVEHELNLVDHDFRHHFLGTYLS